MPASDNGVHTTCCSYSKPYLIPPAPTAWEQVHGSVVTQLHPQQGKEKLHLCKQMCSQKRQEWGWGREGKHVLQSDLSGLLLKKTMEMLQ